MFLVCFPPLHRCFFKNQLFLASARPGSPGIMLSAFQTTFTTEVDDLMYDLFNQVLANISSGEDV